MALDKIKLKLKQPGWIKYAGLLVLALLAYWLIQFWLGPKVPGYVVTKGELIQTVVASGRIESPARVEISSKITGKVVSIPVAEGQRVRAGQTLIVMERGDERATVAQARAAVAQAEARLKQIRELNQPVTKQSLIQAQTTLDIANKQYARNKELSAQGYVSQAQLDDSLRNVDIAKSQLASAYLQVQSFKKDGSDYALAEAALNQARANEHLAQAKLGNTVIKAVSDGILISRDVEQGNVVMPGKTLMVMSPGGKPQLIAQIDEKNMRYLKLGQHALVVADAYPGQRFDAVLAYINPAVDATRGSVEIKLDVVTPPDFLRQDMTVSVDIEVARRADALTLSMAAIRDGAGTEPWVMVMDNGRLQHRTVKLGVRGDSRVEIIEGLREGDLVLPATGTLYKEGKRLRITPS
ncbi:MAG: efflux RND transporter periplasmic adaptor subunit [Gallionella sp.]